MLHYFPPPPQTTKSMKINPLKISLSMGMIYTLAEMKETRRENSWTEEAKKYGATDQLKTSVLFLRSKLGSYTMKGVLKVTIYNE